MHRGLDSLTARTEAGTGTTPPTAEDCCAPAPPVLEFDAAGTLVSHWGGPGQGFDWPVSPGGIDVDAKGNVWITAAGRRTTFPTLPRAAVRAARWRRRRGALRGRRCAARPWRSAGGGSGGAAGAARRRSAARRRGARRRRRPSDRSAADAATRASASNGRARPQVLAHRTIPAADRQGRRSRATTTARRRLDHPADVAVDSAANEVYVADGGDNQRVVVFDATHGRVQAAVDADTAPRSDA